MYAKPDAELLLRELLLSDVLQQIAIDLGLDLNLEGFRWTEREIIENVSVGQVRCF